MLVALAVCRRRQFLFVYATLPAPPLFYGVMNTGRNSVFFVFAFVIFFFRRASLCGVVLVLFFGFETRLIARPAFRGAMSLFLDMAGFVCRELRMRVCTRLILTN